MIKHWIRNLASTALVLLFVAGCGSSGTKETLPPAPPPDATADTPPPVADTPEPSAAFDPNGNPYIPGTSRLLPRTFYFAYDRSVLSQDDLAVLEMHATVLRNNRARTLVLEGHCDERGTREYNLALGERRANSVRAFLRSAGVTDQQMESVSYGEERPEDPGQGDAAWSRNRRAVLVYR
ncbi:MAG: peptidoglycan-associated lipoprotein Pal [Pseudomonadales bacterium]